MENIKVNGFVELSNDDMYDVDGGITWGIAAAVCGVWTFCYGAGKVVGGWFR